VVKCIFFMPSLWETFAGLTLLHTSFKCTSREGESLPIPYVWSAILEVDCLVRRTSARRELWLSGGSA
jgi:hypothetical protein